jgi:hypothetical protein
MRDFMMQTPAERFAYGDCLLQLSALAQEI